MMLRGLGCVCLPMAKKPQPGGESILKCSSWLSIHWRTSAGKSLQLELFDHSLGEQGHVMLDHVMLVSCDGCQMEEPSILARTLSAQPTGADSAYLIPASHNDFSLQYLYQGEASALTIRMDAPI